MNWCWQDALATKYTREFILDDVLSDNSMVFEMAKEDVAKILQKTKYNFIVQKLHYDDIYGTALVITKKQIHKILKRKKGFLFCKSTNCCFGNIEIIRKIIQRIANNIKNLFDERYRTCIKNSISQELEDNFKKAFVVDPLDIILEEEIKTADALKRTKDQEEYLEYLKHILKVDSSGQTLLSFT